MDGTIPAEDLATYTDYLIKGDRTHCLNFITDYLGENSGFIQLYEEVLKKSLYNIGSMWEYNKITVATEHLATSITEFLLNNLYEEITSSDKNGKKIIVACTEKEEHQVGGKMVADVFEYHGWETYFLGANTTTIELITFIDSIQPELLALSISVYFNLANLEKTIALVQKKFPDLQIIIGGQAFTHGGQEIFKKYSNLYFIPDLYTLELFIKTRITSKEHA